MSHPLCSIWQHEYSFNFNFFSTASVTLHSFSYQCHHLPQPVFSLIYKHSLGSVLKSQILKCIPLAVVTSSKTSQITCRGFLHVQPSRPSRPQTYTWTSTSFNPSAPRERSLLSVNFHLRLRWRSQEPYVQTFLVLFWGRKGGGRICGQGTRSPGLRLT